LEIYRVPVFEILKEIPTMAEISLSLSLGEMEKEITSSQTQKINNNTKTPKEQPNLNQEKRRNTYNKLT
jgi:hypothetical protein